MYSLRKCTSFVVHWSIPLGAQRTPRTRREATDPLTPPPSTPFETLPYHASPPPTPV